MTIKQEESRQNEMRRAATREKIREANLRLDKERLEFERAYSDMHIQYSIFYLKGLKIEDLIRIEREREDQAMFLTKIFPKIKEGLYELLKVGYIDEFSDPKKTKERKELPN